MVQDPILPLLVEVGLRELYFAGVVKAIEMYIINVMTVDQDHISYHTSKSHVFTAGRNINVGRQKTHTTTQQCTTCHMHQIPTQ